MGSARKLIIPVFIPHAGCPHRCIFCDQNDITGREGPPGIEEVRVYLSGRLGPDTADAVIAFYGGSFTCMDAGLQEGYLGAAKRLVDIGHAAGVRLSTRPDCMDEAAAGYLRSMGVVTVELGAQSMEGAVLRASARGHTASETARAARLVRESGMELGIQVMAGLPGDTHDGFMRTVRKVIELGPGFVRIYPVLVVKGAPLERLYARGEYSPLSTEEAVTMCADAVELFEGAGVRVIRTGLQPSEDLEASLVAGPYHPAFGHMVRSEAALRRMTAIMEAGDKPCTDESARFIVNPSELSTYLGINKSNLDKLRRTYGPGASILPDACVEIGGLARRI